MKRSTPAHFVIGFSTRLLIGLSLAASTLLTASFSEARDIDPSGFSLYSGDQFYVLTDGVFSSEQNIQVRFEAAGNQALKPYGGVDVRLYRIPHPLEFLKAQKNLHRPLVKANESGEGLANVLSYLWDTWFKKARLAWQRVFSPEARTIAVKEVPELSQTPAHSYKTQFKPEPQFAPLKEYELVDTFRYPVWEAKLNEPAKDTKLDGSSSNFISTPAGNVILPLGRRKPGLYLVEAMIGSYRATTLAFVSNSLAVTKVSSQQALIWTVNGQTGQAQPRSHVMLTDGVGILDQGVGNSDGIFISKRSIPEHSFVMAEDQEGGVSVSENFFYDSEVFQAKIYVFTERPLYQPGDTVSVRAFGRDLKRKGALDVWSALPGTSATLKVVDSTGVELFSKPMVWDGANGGDAEFRLPDSAESGGYTLRLKFEGEEYGAAFRVARFTKPHFEEKIVFDKPAFKVGEAVSGKVFLMYPSGQPVVGADVDLQLRSEQMTMFEATYSYNGPMPVELSTKAYKSNARGEVTFSFPPATRPSRYITSARAMDQGAFRVSSKKEVLIEGYLETFALESDVSSTDPGVPVKVRFVRQGSEVDSSQALAHWQAIRLEDRSVSSGSIADSDRGEFTMKLEKPGHYVVRVVDVNGVTRGTRSHVVMGEALKSVTGQVEILADREDYQIGNSAKLLLTFPFKADEALLTLERNDVAGSGRLAGGADWFKAKRLNDFQWQVEIPIRETFAPNIVFSVAYAQNNEFSFFNKGLAVKKPMIDIVFKADKSSYAPGDKVIVNLETTLQGKPISAIVAVGVVDEMIYVLQPEVAPPIGEFFHHQRRNQVRTTSSLSFYSFNPATSDSAQPKSTSAERDLKLLQERARRDANDTAFWNGKIHTDSQGKAHFEFIMPDALTRWRITGRAMALGSGNPGAVGESKSFLLSVKDFYFKWTGPVRFREGDHPQPVVVVFNSGGKDIAGNITLSGDAGYKFAQKIQMHPGANTVVLEKAPSESQNLEARLEVDGKSVDALTLKIDFIANAWTQSQSQPVDFANASSVRLPADAQRVQLKLMPNSSYQFLRIADDLMDYPWGCVEQTASRLVPLTMAVAALEKTEGPSKVTLDLRDRVATERRRLIAMAGPNAVFTWWGDQTGGDLLLTAHAYHADFRAAQLLSIALPKENWEHLLEIYAKSKSTTFADRAYTLWVINKTGLPTDEQLKSLLKEIQAVTPPIEGKLSGLVKQVQSSAAAALGRNTAPIDASSFVDAPASDRGVALLIAGSLAARTSVPMPAALKSEADGVAKVTSTSSGFQAAQLMYQVQAKSASDTSAQAEKILKLASSEMPTIDRAMALAFIDQALPQSFDLKSAAKNLDPGPGWKREKSAAVVSFSYAKGGSPSLSLPALPGAVGDLSYQSTEPAKSSLPFTISRKLYKLALNAEKSKDADADYLNLSEVKAEDSIDSRSLYIDEITVNPNGSTGRYMLLEVPLPAGGEVDGSTWGLAFEEMDPHFTEARPASNGMGYSLPIESIDKETKFHQLIRFSSRGKFKTPPARIFKMYRASDRAFEGDLARREFNVQ